MPTADVARRRWRIRQRVTAALLAVWFGVTFGVAYFARELNGHVLGWPFSFWVAAQGAPIVYLALVLVYARLMGRLDDASGVAQDD
jgi:putative solute:sodium symporter small subunit